MWRRTQQLRSTPQTYTIAGMTLGQFIRSRRETLGVSLRSLSATLLEDHGKDLDHSTLARIETGATRRLDPSLLVAIAGALGLTDDDLARALRLSVDEAA